MVFGLSGAAIAAGTVAVAGLGMSAASAAGAFSGPVEKRMPTPGEIEAGKEARYAYQIGRKIQVPLDQQARSDLQYLGSDQAMDAAGDQGANQFWQQAGSLGQGLQQATKVSGGPGSGRFFSQLGQGTSMVDAGVMGGRMQGRLDGLNQYLARKGQFLTRRTNDLQTGLATMSTGGAQAAQNQNDRIQAQIKNNIAANQAMGQIGGSLMSVGMMGMSAAGGGTAGQGSGAGTGGAAPVRVPPGGGR
jgi:hypothetical protein